MPYRVLIADDERVIREGMATLIDWSQLGFTVCGLAANGLEALEMVSEVKPDLMLVDIQMPLVSGLLLIEKAKVIAPGLEFIIITGHDEFDFARQAINLGVRDYLLKPVKEHRLLESVERIRKEMDRQRRSKEQYDFAMLQLQKNMTVLRDQFLQQLIQGQLVQEEIDEMLGFHKLQAGFDHFCLLRQSRQSRLSGHGEWDRQLLRFAAQNIFEELLSRCGPYVCTADLTSNL
ncbi:MAG: response regulator, partial [Clostridia bacterium]|nr:response regulator [Clostridia bacterium]